MSGGRKLGPTVTTCVLLVALVAPVAEAAEKKRHERRFEDTYASPAQIVEVPDVGGSYVCSSGGSGPTRNLGCVEIPIKPTERFLELEIVDASGLPAPAWVAQEGTHAGGPVCGSTDKPMRIAPGVAILLWMYPYMASPLCPGISTTGTVTATLSDLP
ncbi:MAG: hypothetical protein ACRDKT_05700 [Actinomycetota bacterium]